MQFITTDNRIAVENFQLGIVYTITYTNGNYKSMACTGIGPDYVMFQDTLPDLLYCLNMSTSADVSTIEVSGGGGGTTNYNELINKPSINGVVLVGNKTGSDLSLVSESDLSEYVTDTELTGALAGKQDVINDLTDIRSGAAAGATAVQPAALDDYATNASLVSALSGKQDTLSTSQLTAVNSGITAADVSQITTNKNNISLSDKYIADHFVDVTGKNKLNAVNRTGTRWVNNTIDLPAGDYVLSIGNLETTATSEVCQIGVLKSGDVALISYTTIPVGDNVYVPFTIAETAVTLRIYAANTSETAIGETVTISNAMICTAEDWHFSHKYIPYST